MYITTKEGMEKIRSNMRLRRIEMGLTQEELARRVGVCLSTIRRFEGNQNIGVELFISLVFTLDFLPDLVESSKIYKFNNIKERIHTQKLRRRVSPSK